MPFPFWSALGFWFLCLIAAMASGGLRETVTEKHIGERPAHFIHTLGYCVALFAGIWVFTGRMDPIGTSALLLLGAFWMLLTVAFECFFFYVRGESLERLLAEYAIWRGRLWPLVLATLLFGPLLTASLH
jgi:hypothetical protein